MRETKLPGPNRPALPSFGTTLSVAILAIAGACAEAPKKSGSQGATLPTATGTMAPPNTDRVEASKASTELLQKAVARVLGFVDIYGYSVTIYQDAYSSLYDTLGRSDGSGEPVFYYSPLFVADSPTVTILPTGEVKLTLKNKVSAELVRPKVIGKLQASVLKNLNPDANRVGLVPLDAVDGKLKAFGKEYKADVEKNLSVAIIKIPKADFPANLLSVETGKFDAAGVLAAIDSFPISYKYYVQKVKEQDCHFKIDDSYVRNMFQDNTCPKLSNDPTQADIDRYAADLPTNQNIKNIGPILQQIQKPISACMAGQEVEKLLARSSVKCTKSATDFNGQSSAFSPQMVSFMDSTVAAAVDSARFTPDPNSWDNQTVAAAVKLFGNPKELASNLKKFTNEVLLEQDATKQSEALRAQKNFVEKINQFSSLKNKEEGSSNSKAGGGGFSLGWNGFGVGANSNSANANADFTKDLVETVRNRQSANLRERVNHVKDYFQTHNLDHDIQEVNGEFFFVPSITIHVQASVDKIKQAASGLSTNDLGDIVGETEQMTVSIGTRNEVRLEGRLLCDTSETAFSRLLHEAEWWNNVNFFADLSRELTNNITGTGCREVTLRMWYKTRGTAFDVINQDGLSLNVTLTAPINASTAAADTQNQVLELYPSHLNTVATATRPFRVRDGLAETVKFTQISIRP